MCVEPTPVLDCEDTMSQDCHPRRCRAPGPGCGWYRTKMKVSRHEKPNIAVAGANIDRRKRPIRPRVGATGMARTKRV